MPKLQKKLTDAVMRKLEPPAKGSVLHYDPELEGFAARVTEKNAKAGVLVYHFEKVERRDTLGTWPLWTVEALRERAKEWKRGLILGIDPRGKPKAPVTETLKARAEQYLAAPHAKRTKRPLRDGTAAHYRLALLKYAAPLHDRPFQDVRRREIAELLDELNRTRGASAARLTRTALSRLFSWGMARDYCEFNPVTGTEGWSSRKRTRNLADREIWLFWRATANKYSKYNCINRILLRIGCRPDEIQRLAVSEILGDILELPEDRTKSWSRLRLPLPRQPLEELNAWSKLSETHYFISDSDRGPGKGGRADYKKRLDRRIARIQAELRLGRPLEKGERPLESDFLPHWQIRDLRRTVETRLAKLGTRQEVIDKVLNHGAHAITGIYNQHQYLGEMHTALQAWSDEIDRIVNGPPPEAAPLVYQKPVALQTTPVEPVPDNVVPMRQQR